MVYSHKIFGREKIVLTLLFAFSLIVRIPLFHYYPIFRMDEIGENIRGLAIVEYGFIPLTNNAEFIGAFYNYLVALTYMVKPSIIMSRFLMVIFGSVTVPLLYVLTYKITKDRFKSLLASLTLALSPAHILITSHVAWSASLAPFFLTLSLLYLFKSKIVGGKSRRDWLFFGLTLGLALQAHPSTVASYVAFLAAWSVIFGKELLMLIFKHVKYCILGFAIGYSNMLLFNIINPLGSVRAIFEAPWTGLHRGISLQEFVRRIVFIIVEYATMILSGIPILPLKYLMKNILFYTYLILFLIMIVYAVLRSRLARFLLIYILIALLVLSIGTKGAMSLNIFGFAWGPHYLQQLLPLNSILIAEMLSVIIRFLKGTGKIKGMIISTVLTLLIVLWPFTNLVAIYGFINREKCTNEVFLRTISDLKREYGENTSIFVEVSSKRQGTLILYGVAVLEKMNVYPPITPFRTHVTLEDLKHFLNSNRNKTLAILVLQPEGYMINFIKKLAVEKLIIIENNITIRACFNTPLYKIIIVKPHSEGNDYRLE